MPRPASATAVTQRLPRFLSSSQSDLVPVVAVVVQRLSSLSSSLSSSLPSSQLDFVVDEQLWSSLSSSDPEPDEPPPE